MRCEIVAEMESSEAFYKPTLRGVNGWRAMESTIALRFKCARLQIADRPHIFMVLGYLLLVDLSARIDC